MSDDKITSTFIIIRLVYSGPMQSIFTIYICILSAIDLSDQQNLKFTKLF